MPIGTMNGVPNDLRAFSYSRASRDPKHRGRSTADQETENLRTIEAYGWRHVDSFEDLDRSASRHARRKRDDYDAMVERVRAGECDVLVAWECSRWHRDLEAYVKLRDLCAENGVYWCYNGRVYDMNDRSDRFTTGLDALRSEDESAAIRDRILRTTRLEAERGKPHGRIGFGFRREYDPETGDLLRQVPDFRPDGEGSADLVVEMAARVAAGESIYAIARDFDRRGIPIPGPRWAKNAHRPTRWDPQTIKSILLRPANIAKRIHHEKIVSDGLWEPILRKPDGAADELLFYTCKRILTNPDRSSRHGREVEHVLSGAVFCGVCGGVLRVRHGGKVGLVYTCIIGFCVSMRTSMLERYVQEWILQWLEDPAHGKLLTPPDADERARELMVRIERNEAAVAEALEQMKKHRLSPTEYTVVTEEWKVQIERDRTAIGQLTVPPLLARVQGPRARAVWADLTIPERRDVIRMVSHVTLNKARAWGVKRIEPDRVTFGEPR